jgi:hypothetical protein
MAWRAAAGWLRPLAWTAPASLRWRVFGSRSRSPGRVSRCGRRAGGLLPSGLGWWLVRAAGEVGAGQDQCDAGERDRLDRLAVDRHAEHDGHDRDKVDRHRAAGSADPADQRGEGGEGKPGADGAEDGHGEQASQRGRGVSQPGQPGRGVHGQGGKFRAPDDGQGTVAVLQRRGEIERDPVQDGGQQHQADAQHAGAAGADGRRIDRDHAGQAHHQAGQRAATWHTPRPQRRDRGGEQRRRAVDRPGQRGRDRPLREREQHERAGHPHQAEQGDRCPVSAAQRLAGGREAGEQGDTEQQPQPGHRRRRETVHADLDQQERRAPHHRDSGQQGPVPGRETGGGARTGISHTSTVPPMKLQEKHEVLDILI